MKTQADIRSDGLPQLVGGNSGGQTDPQRRPSTGCRVPAQGCLVNIDVADLDEAIAFYEQGVGLRLARRLFDGTVAEMLGVAVPVYLTLKAAGSAASPRTLQRRDYARHWTPVHLDFVVADLARALAQAVAAGAIIEAPPQAFAWGHLAELSDPFGNGLCFVQWRDRGYGELAYDAPPRPGEK